MNELNKQLNELLGIEPKYSVEYFIDGDIDEIEGLLEEVNSEKAEII